MKPNRDIDENQQEAAEEALCQALVSLTDVEDCRNFLLDLCTPAELQALVDRWQVVEYLENGVTYRRINELTGVSVTTVGRVARCLADGHGGYRTALQQAAPKNTTSSH